MKKSVLVTGGAGFIGSNFLPYFLGKYPEYMIVNLDKLTYAGDLNNLIEISEQKNYQFKHGDICDRKLVEELFSEFHFDSIIHFAAESHVDNSIHGPESFIRTNINGTFTLIDAARKYWMLKPFEPKKSFEHARFHHISTDEVYGSLGPTGFFSEETAYAPNSPYSASKASSDMLVRSYFHTYGMNVVTTNCSNNYGPKQHKEKFIPTIIRSALNGKTIPVYGDGKNIRDWLYVQDHCLGIDLVFHNGKAGDTYNIGGKNERVNLDIARRICQILDEKKPRGDGKSYVDQIAFVQDRPGHDKRYAIDAEKIETQLGWKANENFETGIMKTVDWYIQHPESL